MKREVQLLSVFQPEKKYRTTMSGVRYRADVVRQFYSLNPLVGNILTISVAKENEKYKTKNKISNKVKLLKSMIMAYFVSKRSNRYWKTI